MTTITLEFEIGQTVTHKKTGYIGTVQSIEVNKYEGRYHLVYFLMFENFTFIKAHGIELK